jgi:hypothetical protein
MEAWVSKDGGILKAEACIDAHLSECCMLGLLRATKASCAQSNCCGFWTCVILSIEKPGARQWLRRISLTILVYRSRKVECMAGGRVRGEEHQEGLAVGRTT